jgi:aryl-alcohol dehydrogenase-like predicted oxidoreductase
MNGMESKALRFRADLGGSMHYRHLGRTGIQVSELSYGTWVTFGNQIDVGKAVDCLGVAFDLCVNFFDCVEVYAGGRAEEILGCACKLGWRREVTGHHQVLLGSA